MITPLHLGRIFKVKSDRHRQYTAKSSCQLNYHSVEQVKPFFVSCYISTSLRRFNFKSIFHPKVSILSNTPFKHASTCLSSTLRSCNCASFVLNATAVLSPSFNFYFYCYIKLHQLIFLANVSDFVFLAPISIHKSEPVLGSIRCLSNLSVSPPECCLSGLFETNAAKW